MTDTKTLYCSFCGKPQHEVRKLIAGPTVFICDECVELCMDIVKEDRTHIPGEKTVTVPVPTETFIAVEAEMLSLRRELKVRLESLRALCESGDLSPEEYFKVRIPLKFLACFIDPTDANDLLPSLCPQTVPKQLQQGRSVGAAYRNQGIDVI